MNTARGNMDEPGPGLAGRGPFTDLKSPLPDVWFAGGRDAVFHALVDHDLPRTGQTVQREAFADAINPGNYGKGAFDLRGAYADHAIAAGRDLSGAGSANTGGDQSSFSSQVPVCVINSRLLASPTVQLA